MGRLFQIVYTSRATKLLTPEELRQLLAESNQRNSKAGITGLLLYKDGNFMQVLEGEEDAVRNLFNHVSRDTRHRGVLVLLRAPIEKREFPDWSMAFRDLNSAESKAIPGYSEFLNSPLTGKEFSSDPTRTHKLLLLFKKNIR